MWTCASAVKCNPINQLVRGVTAPTKWISPMDEAIKIKIPYEKKRGGFQEINENNIKVDIITQSLRQQQRCFFPDLTVCCDEKIWVNAPNGCTSSHFQSSFYGQLDITSTGSLDSALNPSIIFCDNTRTSETCRPGFPKAHKHQLDKWNITGLWKPGRRTRMNQRCNRR